MKFESIAELSEQFSKGKIKSLPDRFSIDGVEYRFLNSTVYPMDEVFGKDKKKPMAVFSVDRKKENIAKYEEKHTDADDPKSFQDRVVLIWNGTRMIIQPVAAKFVPKARMSMVMVREADIDDDRIIHHKVPIVLSGFNQNQPIKAKVDTGAAVCSLDANNVQVDRNSGMVSFEFGDKRVSMPLVDTQSVLTADNGVENRPVVSFDVVVPNADENKKNRVISKVQFNLNDRSGMPDKVLLGQNFIKAGDYVVMDKGSENKQIESVDWDALQEMFKDIECPALIEQLEDDPVIQAAIQLKAALTDK